MRRLLVCLVVALTATACGGAVDDAGAGPPPTTAAEPSPTATISYPAKIEQAPVDSRAATELQRFDLPPGSTLVAMAAGDLDVYRSRQAAKPMLTLPGETILGTVTVLTVLGTPRKGRARVMLPMRPNGSTGWIDITDTPLFVVDGRIVVDLSERVLRYYEDDEMVLETTVAVGSSRNPTPTGEFFVTDNVTLADAGSPWGPHALGLSARSDTITEYNGGDGIIGIHGTNRPTSIGQAASLGCVRVPNDVIARLHDLVPIGTPVDIVA